MKPISESIYAVLVRQGIAHGRTAIRPAQGIGADAQGEEPTRPLSAQLCGEANRSQTGMGKNAETGAPASCQEFGGQNGSARNTGPAIFAVHTNHDLSNMPKRGPTHAPSERMPPLGVGPRLRIIAGGKP